MLRVQRGYTSREAKHLSQVSRKLEDRALPVPDAVFGVDRRFPPTEERKQEMKGKPIRAVEGKDFIPQHNAQSIVRTSPQGEATVSVPVPVILSNPDRKEWRYIAQQFEAEGMGGDRHEIIEGQLIWIPPYKPGYQSTDMFIDRVFRWEKFVSYRNPLIALIAWWRGRNVGDLNIGTCAVADVVTMAAFSSWIAYLVFEEGTRARWQLPACVTMLSLSWNIFIYTRHKWKSRQRSKAIGNDQGTVAGE